MNSENLAPISAPQLLCPNCGSDQWKSAKMVVLEGTTMSGGKIEGSVRDKGMFGGGVRSFLLSDRWFSWDYDLRADINIVSMTALVESVKKLLVSQGEMIVMPTAPDLPKKIGLLARVTPSEPRRPASEPDLPAEPAPPIDKPWHAHFVSGAKSAFWWSVGAAVVLGVLTALFFGPVAIFVAGLALLSFPVCLLFEFVGSFSGNRKARIEYEKQVAEYPARVAQLRESHAKVLESYDHDLIKYRQDVAKAEAQAAFEAEEASRFARESASYQQEKQRVSLHREMLWERSCVCSRCSTTYLPRELVRAGQPESDADVVLRPQLNQAAIAR